MLAARSVAVVGASPRRPSLGNRVMLELLQGAFAGSVHPVNPNYSEVEGLVTVGSLAELGFAPDLVILAVGDSRLEAQMEAAIENGARSVTVFSPCAGEAADGTPLRDRLAEMATTAGIPVCGPNGMGFVNVEHGLRATGYYMPPDLEPGHVTFLSHSGSLFAAMLHNRRGLRFNLVVSSGQEIATTMAEYLAHAIELESTRVVGMFLETVRRPQLMATALERAAELDVPVVALKVGRTDRGRAAAATHSGALAGEDPAYDAFFAAHGVHRVTTVEEMADTLELFSHCRPGRPGALGAVLDSGGERTLLIDTAEQAGVALAKLAEPTRVRLASVLEPGLEPENPVDAWGTGHEHEEIFLTALSAVAADPGVGAVTFGVDLTAEEDPAEGYLDVILEAAASSPIPFAILSNLASGVDPVQAAAAQAAGIPVLHGTQSGLVALGHLLTRANRRPDGPLPVGPALEAVEKWRTRLSAGVPLDVAEAMELLAAYGIPVVPTRVVESADAAMTEADGLGYPVAVKAASVDHKTDVDGVRLGLANSHEVEESYRDLAARLGPTVMVQPMAPSGDEVALGIVNDVQFGPLVVVAAGGTLVEVLADRVMAVPAVGPDAAARLVDRLKVARLLAGVRARPPADRTSLHDVISRVSLLARDLGGLLEGLDINPLIVHPDGAVAVDALVITRAGS